MTGCGCLGVIAALVVLIVIFVRGSFDAGDPVAQAVAPAVGLALALRWKRERAADLYRQVLQINPSCVEAEEGMARVQARLKQPEDALYHQARGRQLKDRPDEALRLYRQWGKLRPERWESVLRVAECFLEMSRRRDAALCVIRLQSEGAGVSESMRAGSVMPIRRFQSG